MKVLLWIRNLLGVLLLLTSYIAAGALPYQRIFYSMADSIAQIESEQFTEHGYPAGDTLPRASSLEEIDTLDVFTIETSHMTPTGIYCILNPEDGGIHSGGTRGNLNIWEVPYITDNKLHTYLFQCTYGQFYSVKLASGESALVLMDDRIMNTSDSSLKVLPAGTEELLPSGPYYDGNYLKNYFQANGMKYGLQNYTSSYVKMAGSQFSQAYQLTAMILHILTTILFTVCAILLLNVIFHRFDTKKES